ncbi:MAG TPA: ABC transporter ATP-binding protein [Casimicrobiaceae bacterium]|jgi:iron(III) transport system ATP-binding protein|nr:ABC transporter ATP-binding protein [Casimicrobiaceae bacterium]
MARLTITGLTKAFAAFRALDDVTLEVGDGEFVAILGPSGCGKTTLLRQVAGFDRPDAGRIEIGERVVSSVARHVPPEERRIGIVFQSYALWPHMSVADNVAYGLTVTGVRDPERARRVKDALALVELDGFASRRPANLSGGQRQRVALARCLVTEPSLVLLDEPLANLDVHLRASMEREFARFHARTGTTMIYITHDQAEAMALADRIAVMDKGRVLQYATPSLLYREPADATVARFIGEGIVLPVTVAAVHGDGTCDIVAFGATTRMRCAPRGVERGPASACVRAAGLRIVEPGAPGVTMRTTGVIYQGGHFRIEGVVESAPAIALHLHVEEPCALAEGSRVTVAVDDGWVIPAAALG